MLSNNILPVKSACIKTNKIGFKSNDFTSTQPYPNDSFERAGDANGANKKLSTGAKCGIALGIVATTVGGIVLHKHIKNKALEKAVETQIQELENNLPEAQKVFREVFLRNNITEAETKEILHGYKEIAKIKSDKEYAQALFEHTKKNFQIYNPDMKLYFETFAGHEQAYGGCTPSNSEIYVTPKCLKEGRKKVFETMYHEMRHAKQHEFVYNKYPDDWFEGLLYSEVLTKKYGNKELKTCIKCREDKNLRKELDKKEHISEIIEKAFGKASADRVPSEYNNYTKQLNDEFNPYIIIHYPDRFEERDAFSTAKKITDLFFKKQK